MNELVYNPSVRKNGKLLIGEVRINGDDNTFRAKVDWWMDNEGVDRFCVGPRKDFTTKNEAIGYVDYVIESK